VEATQGVPPEAQPETTGEPVEMETEPELAPEDRVEVEGEERTPPPPSEEEVAVRGMGQLMRGLWGGVPRIPGAVALGARLDGGALAVRLAVENTPDGVISIIPFLPNLVSGPPVTGETASVAPADAELFVAGSLDWTQIYNQTLGAASVNTAGLLTGGTIAEIAGEAEAERQPSADETVAAVEKLFGFKFREDLLPALGNEVAISLPLSTGDFRLAGMSLGGEKKE